MKNIGIIVGRFQVPELHPGHLHLIKFALDNFEEVHAVIGVTKGDKLDQKNPLPYEAREIMILETFPELFGKLHTIEDIGNYPVWVQKLDEILEPLAKDGVIHIIGSRDSVATRYKEFGGKHEIAIIEPLECFSGTGARNTIKQNYHPLWHKEARKIAVWAIENQKED